MWRDSQLIVLGGIYPRPAATKVGSDRNVSVCDTTYSPVRLLDTSTYDWKDAYSPDFDAYQVPPVVSSVIGGDSSGKASLQNPEGGFNDSRLTMVFSQKLPRPHGLNGPPFLSNNTTSNIPSNTTSNNPSSTRPPPDPSKARSSQPWPLIGGIIGAFVGAILIIWIVCDTNSIPPYMEKTGATQQHKIRVIKCVQESARALRGGHRKKRAGYGLPGEPNAISPWATSRSAISVQSSATRFCCHLFQHNPDEILIDKASRLAIDIQQSRPQIAIAYQ
ncbi:MAG: hypothetical protein Q9221_004993 [Calogaya cf. arnoldii]